MKSFNSAEDLKTENKKSQSKKMIDFHFVLLGYNYTILIYKRELIFLENRIKNIVLKIIIAILSNEFSEMTNIQCEWFNRANE